MEKVNIGQNAFIYPMPMALVGADVNGKVSFSPVSWVTRLNFKPPMMGVVLGKGHFTNEGILQRKEFSLNFPGVELIEKTDYCGMVSGKTTDKGALFSLFYGELEFAPLIEECPLCMECRLVDTVDLPSNVLYVGEIVSAYTENRFLTDDLPDIEKMKPFMMTMPDNRYWKVGEYLGRAWEVGKKLKQ